MEKMIKNSMLVILVSLILIGCGDGIRSKTIDKVPVVSTKIDRDAKMHYGFLADATVKIYQLGEGDRELLFTEKTSSGQALEEIGNFDPHLGALDSKKFYAYEVSGGENWDIDNDGNIDESGTKNTKTYRAIKRGAKQHLAWWKSTLKGANTYMTEGLE